MRFITALMLIALLFPLTVSADPGIGTWINQDAAEKSQIRSPGDVLTYQFTALVNSVVISVKTPFADVCFIAGILSASGTGRVDMYRAILPSLPIVDNGIKMQDIPFDNSDCVIIVNGTYWVQPTATDGVGSIVVVTGRAG